MDRPANQFHWTVLECASKPLPDHRDEETIDVWLELARERVAAGLTSVLEQALFLLLARRGRDGAREGARRSWEILTGRSAGSDVNRLPRRILRQAPSEEQVVYDAVFYADARETALFAPLGGTSWLRTAVRRVTASAFWTRGTAMFLGGASVMMLFSPTREILLGAVIGMIGASLNEYLVHLGLGHASTAFAKRLRRLGVMGLFAEEINLAHRIHHSKMVADFRADFTDSKTRARIDAHLRREATQLVRDRVATGFTAESRAEAEIDRIIREIVAGGYGVNGTWAGCLSMNVLALPFFLVNGGLAVLFGAPLFMIASSFFLSGFITQSLYSHRYLHMTEDDLARSKDAGTTTVFMRWFMTTPVAKLQVRRHYRHHHEKFDYHGTVNGVIMSYSFADFVLRRGVREAEVRHIVRMRREKFL